MAREGLRTRLRAAIRRAGREHAPVTIAGARIARNGDAAVVSISVRPLQSGGEELLLVSFADIPGQPARARVEADDPRALARLERELEPTRKQLESALHDLETPNHEL